jgi:hypothetical protein
MLRPKKNINAEFVWGQINSLSTIPLARKLQVP